MRNDKDRMASKTWVRVSGQCQSLDAESGSSHSWSTPVPGRCALTSAGGTQRPGGPLVVASQQQPVDLAFLLHMRGPEILQAVKQVPFHHGDRDPPELTSHQGHTKPMPGAISLEGNLKLTVCFLCIRQTGKHPHHPLLNGRKS